jgi:hypothetical protein
MQFELVDCKTKKGQKWPFLVERTGVYRSIGARCGAACGGGLLLKLVSVVVRS